MWSQFCPYKNFHCSSVSTPSAITSKFSSFDSVIMEEIIASSKGLVVIPQINSRAIFNVLIGYFVK